MYEENESLLQSQLQQLRNQIKELNEDKQKLEAESREYLNSL